MESVVEIKSSTAVVALRALSEIWSEHQAERGLDDDVMAAIVDLERVTGIQLSLKSRK